MLYIVVVFKIELNLDQLEKWMWLTPDGVRNFGSGRLSVVRLNEAKFGSKNKFRGVHVLASQKL